MNRYLLYLLLLVSGLLGAQSPQQYFFNNSFTGTAGGPTLTETLSCGATSGAYGTDSIITTNGLCSVGTAFCFNAGGGLVYPNTSITGDYTINVFFKFNTLGGWSRIIDFSNSTADAGIYLLGNCLNFFPNGTVGTCPYFQPNIYYLYTFVRNGTTNVISVYVNGTLFGTYTDAGNIYRPSTTSSPIIFFRDDNVVTCEDKAGCIKYASVSSTELTAAQVDSVWINICSISLPPCAATISYPGSPYSNSLSSPQSVTLTGNTGGKFTSTTGLAIDSVTGAITPSGSTAGIYTVTYTVSDSGVCGTYATTANVTITAPFNCSPTGNTLIFTNYDGGILNIDVDANIPNLKIGVVSYENASINITGTYAGNVTKIVYAGYQGTNNNCNFAVPITSTNINGISPSLYTINQYPPATLSNPNGYIDIICAYSCDLSTNQGGCNTMDQIVAYFNTQLGGTIYSLNSQYCCWQPTATYHVSALSNSCCISNSPTAGFSYAGSPYCSALSASQTPTFTGTTGGTFSASPAGLSINAGTGAIVPSASATGVYTVTYTVAGCPVFTSTSTVEISANPTASISYANTSFCTGAAPQQVTLTGTAGGTFSTNISGLTIDANTGTITPATSATGNYIITYTSPSSGSCTQATATAQINISSVLNTPLSANICNGGTYTFVGQTLDTAGTYSHTFSTSAGCDSIVTLSLGFYTPTPVSIHSNDSVFCSGDSISVCVTTAFNSYLWNGGETSQCIFAKNAGNYYVTVTDANNCSSQSSHLALSVYPAPSLSVTVNGDTLQSLNAIGYQWYLNGNAIANAQSSIYIAQVSGLYQVEITDSNGCKATSTTISVVVTGISKIATEDFDIYPNPVQSDNLHIKTGADFIGSELAIYNAAGQVVFKSEIKAQQFEINLIAGPGIYYVRVNSKSNTFVRKLIHL